MVDILGTLDDKIENNEKKIKKAINLLIESYELYLKNNEIFQGCISDLAAVKSGYAFKSSSWTDDGIKVVKIKNITEYGQIDLNDCSFVNDMTVIKKAEQFKVKGGELVVAMTGATIGKMALIPFTQPYILINQRVGLFIPKESNECSPFLYASCMRNDVLNEIITRGGGSAQPNISGQSIEEISIPLLSQDKMHEFNEKFKVCLSTMQYLLSTNEILNKLKTLYLQKFFG